MRNPEIFENKGRVLRAAAAVVVGVAMLTETLVARAQESWVNWGYSQVGIPEGKPGDKAPLVLSTGENGIIAITTGDFSYTDSAGRPVEFVGKGDPNSDRASLILVDGPVGEGQGAAVNPTVRTLYNWVGVAEKHQDGMNATRWQEVIDERVTSLRDPQNGNGRNGGGLTGPVDVVMIDGRSGRIRETRVVYPS